MFLYEDFVKRICVNWDSINGMLWFDFFFNQGVYGNGGVMVMVVFLNDIEFY